MSTRPSLPQVFALAGSRAGVIVVRITAVYVLAGAFAKLLWADPSSLPAILQPIVDSAPELALLTVIAAELALALVAICAPRLGWAPLATLLVGFVVILGLGLARGDDRCGCFGAAAAVPSWLMLTLDCLALTAIALTRPWRTLRVTAWRPWLAGTAATGGVLAVVLFAPMLRDARASGVEPLDRASDQWRLPTPLPRSVGLRPRNWVGQPLRDTDLAVYVDTSRFPGDANLIIYYETCRHCAKHLAALAAEPGDRAYVLIQIPTPAENTLPVVVHEMPPAVRATLPAGIEFRIRTPWELTVRNGIVTEATPRY